MSDLLPEIAAAFGVVVRATVFVAIMPDCHSAQAKRANAISNSQGIIVYDTAPENMAAHIGHEIGHTVARYRVSCWNTLPIILEEGLCTLISRGLSGAREVVMDGYLPRPVAEHYLNMDLDGLHLLEGEQGAAAYLVATYMAAILGFDKLEELARRASAEGHATIPSDWILEALERAETLRHPNGSGPTPSRIDPLFGRIGTDIVRETVVRIEVSFPDHPFGS